MPPAAARTPLVARRHCGRPRCLSTMAPQRRTRARRQGFDLGARGRHGQRVLLLGEGTRAGRRELDPPAASTQRARLPAPRRRNHPGRSAQGWPPRGLGLAPTGHLPPLAGCRSARLPRDRHPGQLLPRPDGPDRAEADRTGQPHRVRGSRHRPAQGLLADQVAHCHRQRRLGPTHRHTGPGSAGGVGLHPIRARRGDRGRPRSRSL
jgi:hypothetical protein